MAAKINEDLLNERKKCDFNVEELANYLDGGAKATENRRKMEAKVLSTKGLLDEIPEEYLSHKEKYENAIRKGVLFYKAMKDAVDPSLTEEEKANVTYRSMISSAVFRDMSPFGLHLTMFIPAIVGQADEEQKKYWLKRASNFEIVGTYAQTELGHGTFIRGLETTATYDPKTEEFIIHTPTLTAYKWWPGNLGHTTNYCIVMAHLYTQGKSRGVQPFMVQLRDEETHMPLPGIKLGEIGAKLGFNTVNNGFLGFEQHRIKRDRMLMKNAQVLKDGTFKRSADTKLTYGTMVYVRVIIVSGMASQLARSVTIAIRYSAIRRQSQLKPEDPEIQIMDFVTQQHKLFIALASSHAFRLTANWLWAMYTKVTNDLSTGKTDDLPELHALACCLKAVSTSDAAIMTERCRLSCGGHGYMLSSNLPQIYGLVTAACTYEGENTVLMLQTARSLVKAWGQAEAGKPLSPTVSYLLERNAGKEKWENTVEGIIRGFKKVAVGKISAAVKSISKYTRRGLAPEEAWNKSSVQLVAASEAHCRAVILSTYKSEVDSTVTSLSEPLKRVLHQLVHLYTIYWALEKIGDLLLSHASPSAERREHLYKILVIGELGTGKTSIIKRYVHQFFSQHYRATIGVDFALKVLNWDSNTIIRLQLWDIAGQERFGNMTRVYYKEAVGAFIVFDVSRVATFDAVVKWKNDLDAKVQLPDGSAIPCILLANKCDQQKEGIVNSQAKMDEYCREKGFAGWFETSAKENINIEEAARSLVNKILLNDKLLQSNDNRDGDKFALDHKIANGENSRDSVPKSCSC